jgi:hypothetical protein
MSLGKGAYLKKVTSAMGVKGGSRRIGIELQGSSPPSVFVGSWNYPKVFAGPLIAQDLVDSSILDSPEAWIPGNKSQEDIVDYRLRLVRGKKALKVQDVETRFAQKLQEIALSEESVGGEAEFASEPRGSSFSEERLPHGPSAELKSLSTDNARWEKGLEKVFHDTDLKASEGIVELHGKGLDFSRIQKALSVGAMGNARRRKFVPTKWAITATDTVLGNYFFKEVRQNEVINDFEVREFSSLRNHYAVLLLPTAWQFEWSEAFLKILGSEEMVFSDYETNRGKKGYSSVGGCYYSCKMQVLEALAREGKQAGAIVLREARRGYVPMGVFNVRENVKHAMLQEGRRFDSLREALAWSQRKFELPIPEFVRAGKLLGDSLQGRQKTLGQFS